MPRIAGVDIPGNKKVLYALTYVFGVGLARSKEILEKSEVDQGIRADDLTDDQLAQIRSTLENHYSVEGNLRREISMNIKRLTDLGCYRGLRHRKGLPVRGQRTSTNARTRKGPSKAIAGKKKAPK